MYNLLFVIGFSSEADEAARSTLQAALRQAGATSRVKGATVQPTLPGVYNGGDLIARFVFDTPSDLAAWHASSEGQAIADSLADPALAATLERVEYEGGRSGGTSEGSGLYRVALFCANRNPTAERLEAFGRQTLTLPRHVRSIRRWQLSDVGNVSGSRPWTHVWEQEYTDLDGLNGPYMMHPAHWAHVERWFDTEYPDHLVDRVLVHSFCAFAAPVIIA